MLNGNFLMALLPLHGRGMEEVATETLKEGELLSCCLMLTFLLLHLFFHYNQKLYILISKFVQCNFEVLPVCLSFSPFLCHLARCECHGHADHCDTSVTPYRCLCLPESHTEGNNVSNKRDHKYVYK